MKLGHAEMHSAFPECYMAWGKQTSDHAIAQPLKHIERVVLGNCGAVLECARLELHMHHTV